MQSNEKSVEHKMLEETLVARIRIHGKVSDLQDVFTKLNSIAGANAAGSPIVVHHWGGSDDDVCNGVAVDSSYNVYLA